MTAIKNTYHLSLGSNLGDRQKNLENALTEIAQFAKISKQSKYYETDPVGYKNQGKFYNIALEIETELSPLELIFKTQEIEHKMGRKRGTKNGPREIDIDILLYNDEAYNHEHLQIPHRSMHERQFVLEPLNEIAPDKIHPELNQNIQTLWTRLKSKT
ncbi:2-amino-4-hydroxy-6-hydroxymethyldihydropteridine diphosphokinase [Candidatus Peregrinibacteria bacterium]|nr:2-amino-4-hydroxy-6-hydroxymethyldihydropteridine diphosphokinase [Candidatus Peregrinibacteria bacterium]